MDQSRPLFVYFRSFHIPIQMTNINWKKHRWCAWDSNPGQQDGRRRRIHWAIAAPPNWFCLRQTFPILFSSLALFSEISSCVFFTHLPSGLSSIKSSVVRFALVHLMVQVTLLWFAALTTHDMWSRKLNFWMT